MPCPLRAATSSCLAASERSSSRCSNLRLRGFKLFVVDRTAKSFKRMGKTERIGFQILIDMSFNQDRAMRIIRFCQVTQCGRAWPEPMHFSSRNSAFSHDKVISLLCQRCLSSGGLTLIAHRSGFMVVAPIAEATIL